MAILQKINAYESRLLLGNILLYVMGGSV
jgi:hypothetical protein